MKFGPNNGHRKCPLRKSWNLCLVALSLFCGFAQQPGKPASSGTSEQVSEATGNPVKQKTLKSNKLDPPLAAVARGWRKDGARGAQQECSARNIKLENLRLHGIIYVANENRSGEVIAAFQRADGELLAVQDNRIYALIPVQALKRIAAMRAVTSIQLDRPSSLDSMTSKEKHQ